MKKQTVYRSRRRGRSSGWLTLLNFILILIAVGVALSKLYERFFADSAQSKIARGGKKTAASPDRKINSAGGASSGASAEDGNGVSSGASVKGGKDDFSGASAEDGNGVSSGASVKGGKDDFSGASAEGGVEFYQNFPKDSAAEPQTQAGSFTPSADEAGENGSVELSAEDVIANVSDLMTDEKTNS